MWSPWPPLARKALPSTRGQAPSATSTAVFAWRANELDATSTPTNGIIVVSVPPLPWPWPLLLSPRLLPPPPPLLLLLLLLLLDNRRWWAMILPLKNKPFACPPVNLFPTMVSCRRQVCSCSCSCSCCCSC